MLSTTERNEGEINSPEVEFDRKYVRMTVISYLSLVASRRPNQDNHYTKSEQGPSKYKTKEATESKMQTEGKSNEAIFLAIKWS